MRIQAAVIKEQGQTFTVVIVKPQVLQNRADATNAIASFTPVFRVLVALMAEHGHGQPIYYGRTDIARFLSSVPLQTIPWREYRLS